MYVRLAVSLQVCKRASAHGEAQGDWGRLMADLVLIARVLRAVEAPEQNPDHFPDEQGGLAWRPSDLRNMWRSVEVFGGGGPTPSSRGWRGT